MKELAQTNAKLADEIIKLHSNFEKDGASRKTAEYLQKKKDELSAKWEIFDKNDTNLRTQDKTAMNAQDYFIGNKYDHAQGAYIKMRAAIKALQQYISVSTDDDPEKQLNIGQLDMRKINLVQALKYDDTSDTIGIHQTNIDMAKCAWNDWQSIYMEYQHTYGDNYDANEYVEMQNAYINAIGVLQTKITTANAALIPVPANNNGPRTPELPKINIPEFDGKISAWNSFHDLFNQIIHKNKTIDNTSKIHYLKTLVKGEAARLIAHLPPTAENYGGAYDTLVKRYSNTRIQLGKLLDCITELPQLTSETCAGLKNSHDTVRECLLGIGNLKVNTENWDSLLTHLKKALRMPIAKSA